MLTTSTPPVLYGNDLDDPTIEQMMAIVEVSGVLDFWDRPEEDIYSD